MIPPSVFHGLQSVPGLRKGRSPAREPGPVTPVPDNVVQVTLSRLSVVVADMVRFQRLTGCRPGEVCDMRPCDIDRSEDVWSYRPESHKTEHHGKERIIFIGPKAQEIIRPYLLRQSDHYCFIPSESEKKRHAEMRANRRSPVQPSQRNRRKPRPKRYPGGCYCANSYRRAIHRACDLAGVERWSPNRLRHTAATEIRRQFGIEASQVVLGHSDVNVTQVYAERDFELAKRIMKNIG